MLKESIFFSKIITKSLTALDSDRRLFEGILTVEMVDKQNEITIVDELMKVLPVWMARNAPITDTHSNRVIGRGINFSKTFIKNEEGEPYPAITIQGEIFKDYSLDSEIWDAIKSGEYKGLSFGGATKADRTPILQKDGSTAFSLRDLEHYEVAVCPDPAVPLALITQYNDVAKAMIGKGARSRGDGTMVIQCTKFGCYVDKSMSEMPLRTSDPPEDLEDIKKPKKKTSEMDKEQSDGGNEWSDKPPTVDDHTNPQQPYSGTGKEKTEKEKTVAHVESVNTEVPLRGIRGTGYSGQTDPITGTTEKDDDKESGKTKSDYDMTGIIRDPKEDEKDEKSKNSAPPQTISANEGIRGKPEGVVDDPEVLGKEKADIIFQSGSGTKGSFETSEQGSHDTRQITDINDEKNDKKITEKQNNNYINMQTNIKDKNIMADEDKKPEEEKVEEKKSETDTQKSTTDVAAQLEKISQAIVKFDTSKLEKSLDELASRVKALETPTDLPLKPKVQADDDIGAKVKVPDTYQSNSQQASIRDSDPQNENEKDEGKLTMQEKSEKTAKPEPVEKSLDAPVFTTETPRPGGVAEDIMKSAGDGLNPILKAARESGYDGLSGVARDILKGKFYKPTEGEIPQW